MGIFMTLSGIRPQAMGLLLAATSFTAAYGKSVPPMKEAPATKTAGNFQTYELDSAHTLVGFEVAHLVISTVEGSFGKFSGSFAYDANNHKLQEHATIEIETASIDTKEPDRDKHLKGADFFDAAKHPKITFVSEQLLTNNEGKPTQLKGKLTLHGVTKEVTLDVDFKGSVTDPWGNDKMVFKLTGKINRMDFGLTWNKTLDKGGALVGEEVTFNIRVEANAKKLDTSIKK